MNKLLDLRFVIGVFFSLVGVILIVAGLGSEGTLASGISSRTVDLVCGGCMGSFGMSMLLITYLWKTEE